MNTADLQPGPLKGQNLFIRNVQPHPDRDDIWIVEAQRGEKGKGKVWTPTLIARNPRYDPKAQGWYERHEFLDCARTKPCQKSHRSSQWEVNIWWHPNYYWIEAYFEDHAAAIEFMIHTGGRYAFSDAPRHP